jgi:large subunit ribosomal protein LX
MSEVKAFRVTGEIKKPSRNIKFSKEMTGLKKEDVIERLYSEMGSRHKAKRFEIKITKIEEEKSATEKTAKKK